MCGIYGTVSFRGERPHQRDALARAGRALHHRGPDGHGCWEGRRAVLGATRLRIVDLDPRADQPFADPAGRVATVVNGEVYNARMLRNRYRDYPFRTTSDAECVLPLYLDRGPRGLADLDGMFAVAVWDDRTGELILARDRAGEKPLFYARAASHLHFASEIAALLEFPDVRRALDRRAAAGYVTHGYVPEPRTLFEGIRQVPAGAILTTRGDEPSVFRYWDVAGLPVQSGPADIRALRHAISDAVSKQLRADVPVGVFASGGLDSAILTALAAQVRGPDRTCAFSVGFAERSYDERRHARRLADALGVRHVEVEADPDALSEALHDLIRLGEPVGDPAALPTVVLARVARRHVTAVLSGEGGDELFGGYPTYVGHRLAGPFRTLPRAVRRGLGAAAGAIPASARRVPLEYLATRFLAELDQPWPIRHRAWFGSGLPTEVLRPRYRHAAALSPLSPAGSDIVGGAMRLDYATALRDRLLVKVDRATMLASLEARAPFLDQAVTRAALALPGGQHVRGTRTKRVLREVARPWVPRFILRRRKRGLSVPVGAWINDRLAPDVDRMLARDRLDAYGMVDADVVARLKAAHRARRANHGRGLWTLYVLQVWLEHWAPEAGDDA